MQIQLAAVGAFKSRGEIAWKRQAAAVAERRADEAHLPPAIRPDKAVPGRGALLLAKLADLGIEEAEAGVEPAFDGRGRRSHAATINFLSPNATRFRLSRKGEEFLFAAARATCY